MSRFTPQERFQAAEIIRDECSAILSKLISLIDQAAVIGAFDELRTVKEATVALHGAGMRSSDAAMVELATPIEAERDTRTIDMFQEQAS